MNGLLLFHVYVYITLTCVHEVNTKLQIYVTKEECGRTVDLASVGSLVLDYDGVDLGDDDGGRCVITAQNNDRNEMICIKTNSSLNFACSLISSYNFGGRDYSCYDFLIEPICERTHSVFATFQSSFSTLASVYAVIYVTPVTTTRKQKFETTTYWYSPPAERSEFGLAFGLAVGSAFVILLFAACAYISRRGIRNNQSGQPFNVQYQQENQPTHQPSMTTVSQQQSQHSTNTHDSHIQNSADLAGYHVHPAVNVTIADQQQQTANQSGQNNSFSAPPPPYPGY